VIVNIYIVKEDFYFNQCCSTFYSSTNLVFETVSKIDNKGSCYTKNK